MMLIFTDADDDDAVDAADADTDDTAAYADTSDADDDDGSTVGSPHGSSQAERAPWLEIWF